jgi:DsbC/DsbD-like thiol-disulfide interchange protein/cytochrome c biogenesis protein CcdA
MLGKLKSAIRAACCAAVTILLLAAPAAAQPGGPPHIRPHLELESAAPAPGQTVALALVMTPEPKWHGYWSNPGDAGVPLSIRWSLPPGLAVGAFDYPVPGRLLIAGLMNYVYETEYALLAQLRVPADAKPGARLRLEGEAEWLACTDEVCVPERGRVGIDVVVGDGAVAPAQRARFDAWRAALPKPLGSPARFAVAGDRLRIAVPLPASVDVDDPYVFPATERALRYSAPQSVTRNGDTLIVETQLDTRPERLAGVLRLDGTTGLAFDAVPGAVPPAGAPVTASAGGAPDISLLAALGGALLGGLLLNVMPCVFPILSLKALGLARAGVDERTARTEALAYAAGVILTCLALGGLLLVLRAGGAAVGWGVQLQDPRVIALLLLLVTAVALNLAGLFELPTIGAGDALAHKGGTAGAFWTGALAAFVATPCTGPFMAAALGAALVLPPLLALAVFGGLGLGLALPFLAIGFVPALRRRMPRPGLWMQTLRHVLAVPMFLTGLGLAWLLGRQSGVNGMAVGLSAALLLALGLWWAGARQARGRSFVPAFPALAVAAVLALTLAPIATSAEAKPGALGARPFTSAALAEARASGAPVFVYFTADWCITCKVNERTAIDRAEVAQAFARAGVKVLLGDWTRGDATIGRFLADHGRSGVPLYLFYRPGRSAPEVLPQLLTPATLTALVS